MLAKVNKTLVDYQINQASQKSNILIIGRSKSLTDLRIMYRIIRDHIEEGDERQECETCGRRFNEEAYLKHI